MAANAYHREQPGPEPRELLTKEGSNDNDRESSHAGQAKQRMRVATVDLQIAEGALGGGDDISIGGVGGENEQPDGARTEAVETGARKGQAR